MEMERFNDYEIANLTDSALEQISELEKTMSTQSDRDIVLVAYQNKDIKNKEN